MPLTPGKKKLKTQSRFNIDNDQHNNKASLTTKGITCKKSCSIFVKRLGVNELDKINEIHSLSFRMTKETKLSIFSVHNILPRRVLLYKMKITDSDLCLNCGSQETLQHLLVSCPLLRTF